MDTLDVVVLPGARRVKFPAVSFGGAANISWKTSLLAQVQANPRFVLRRLGDTAVLVRISLKVIKVARTSLLHFFQMCPMRCPLRGSHFGRRIIHMLSG